MRSRGFVEPVACAKMMAMGEVNPEQQLEIGRGVFKRLGDCAGSEIESAIGLIAQRWERPFAVAPSRTFEVAPLRVCCCWC